MARDYYQVLGVGRNASDKEIRQAYRRLARKYHPDLNPGGKDNEARFKEINAAHEVLSDPDKRKKYNMFGENWKHADQFSRAGTGGRGGQFFWHSASGSGTPFDLGDLSGLGFGNVFDEFLGRFRGSGRPRATPRNVPVEVPLDLTLDEAYSGVTRIVQMPPMPGTNAKRLEVKVPPGVDTGTKVHVPAGDGTDLYLVVNIAPHRRFTRKGADLYLDLSMPLDDAILGSEQEVHTLKGKVALTVPPESQNGQVFRLRSQGMPRLNNPAAKGDLFVTLKVILPTNLSDNVRDLFREIRRGRTGKDRGV